LKTDSYTLVTGASGFVGQALCKELATQGVKIRAVSRSGYHPDVDDVFFCDDIAAEINWEMALTDVDCVIHLAAYVHAENLSDNSDDRCFQVNVDGTLQLAKQAAAAGVRRFIYTSTIKVYGDGRAEPYTEVDRPCPKDSYGISKLRAEEGLQRIAAISEMDICIIRPPIVYGAGVKANFQSLIRWVRSGVPLPLGAVHNKRSFIALDNLIDILVTCIEHPAAANQTFLASDGEDLSTSELIRLIGGALGRPARLFPVPIWLLNFTAGLFGQKMKAQRLCGNFQVDISKVKELLGWSPPVSVIAGLRRTVAGECGNQAPKQKRVVL